jgi:hypothetical protein
MYQKSLIKEGLITLKQVLHITLHLKFGGMNHMMQKVTYGH